MNPAPRSLLRLVLVPAAITCAVSLARVGAERLGWVNVQSGGAFAPLGITWLIPVVGAWLG